MRLVVALLLSLGVALGERQTGEACQPCRSSSACAALSAPFTRQLQTQNLLSWETSIAETVCHAGVCVPEAAQDLSGFCDRLQGKVAAEQEQPAAAAGTVLRKGAAEGSQHAESAQERRRSLQEAAAQQGQQGGVPQAESTAQATVARAIANAAGLGAAERNETQQPRQPVVAGASFSVHGSSSSAGTTAAIRPPVANINLAELARWATGASPALEVAGEAAERTQPVSRSLGEIGFPFLDYGNEGWGSGGVPVPPPPGWTGEPVPHPPGWGGQPVPPPQGWGGQPVPPPQGWGGQPVPSPPPVAASPSPKPSGNPGGGESETGSFGPGSGGNPGGTPGSPRPHKSPSPSPKPHNHKSPSPKPHKSPSPKPHPSPSPGPPTGEFYDPRGGDPTVVYAVSPLSANVDNAYLRAIGANIVSATNLLEVDADDAEAGHFFRQVEDDAPKANVLAYGKGYVELQGAPLRVIPHVMNLEACARHCDADEQCTHWRRCAGGDCGAKLQECELMAAPEEGTLAGASPNTVAPSVLEERAPAIRYIDPAQSNVIMESGTKSPTEFPTALYGCPYPAVPNGQLGQCTPPPQCNCAGGVCYGAC